MRTKLLRKIDLVQRVSPVMPDKIGITKQSGLLIQMQYQFKYSTMYSSTTTHYQLRTSIIPKLYMERV